MPFCSNCKHDFGPASSIVCLHCGEAFHARRPTVEPEYRRTKTKLSYDARRVLEFLEHVPTSLPAPTSRTIAAALTMDWFNIHPLLDQLKEDGLITSIVSRDLGSQFYITPRGKTFL
jgi:DNA-binding MarR family transcriptional regulator